MPSEHVLLARDVLCLTVSQQNVTADGQPLENIASLPDRDFASAASQMSCLHVPRPPHDTDRQSQLHLSHALAHPCFTPRTRSLFIPHPLFRSAVPMCSHAQTALRVPHDPVLMRAAHLHAFCAISMRLFVPPMSTRSQCTPITSHPRCSHSMLLVLLLRAYTRTHLAVLVQ